MFHTVLDKTERKCGYQPEGGRKQDNVNENNNRSANHHVGCKHLCRLLCEAGECHRDGQ